MSTKKEMIETLIEQLDWFLDRKYWDESIWETVAGLGKRINETAEEYLNNFIIGED